MKFKVLSSISQFALIAVIMLGCLSPLPLRAETTETKAKITLAAPTFSHFGGFYSEPFYLEIQHSDPEAELLYTTDGSEPQISNLGGSTFLYKNSYPYLPGDPFGSFLTHTYQTNQYSSALYIYDRSSEPDSLTHISSTRHLTPTYFPEQPVRKAFVVRAKAVREEANDSPVVSHSYFIGDVPHEIPVISISISPERLFDYENGFYVAGVDFDEFRTAFPDVSDWHNANYKRDGDEWEYPAHFEYFPVVGQVAALNQDIGIRIHGGTSRNSALKSLRLYARNEYGASTFDYAFFNSTPDASFKRLILRNSGNDISYTYLHDASFQTLVSSLRFDTQAYQPAVVYLNGEYWGMLNIRERYDDKYLKRNYEVEEDEIDLLENHQVIKEGDAEHYNAMLSYINDNDITSHQHYAHVKTLMDVDNYIDYQIAEIFAANLDWPGNNLLYWRKRTSGYVPNSPYGQDGRWRWMMQDMDFAFGLSAGDTTYTNNTLAVAAMPGGTAWPNPDWSTLLFRSLLQNEEFRIGFISRFCDLLNTVFLPSRTSGTVSELSSIIASEMPRHISRWKSPVSTTFW
ncbi:MAG: CotH kinase family protein, partial [Candidatus Cloacimonetes bacterium]|nr:CotH kinase family protein [Candidatus Cloacimonadota bacterium]